MMNPIKKIENLNSDTKLMILACVPTATVAATAVAAVGVAAFGVKKFVESATLVD